MLDRIWIWFADNGNIRKWQREPFEEGTEFVSTITPAEDGGLVRRLQALQEHLRHQPLTHADAVDIETIGEAASALASERAAHAKTKRERDEARTKAGYWQAEYLNACRDASSFSDDLVRAEAALAEARRERDEALKALEPFAAVAEHDIGDDETDDDIFWPISNARYSMSGRLRVGHLRAARRARTGGKNG